MPPDREDRGCCYKCTKYSVFTFNLLFGLVGCVILGSGVYMLMNPPTAYLQDVKVDSNFMDIMIRYINIIIYVIIGIGSVVTLTGLFGCCGAIRESQCLLGMCLVFLTIIFFILALIAVILWAAFAQVPVFHLQATVSGNLESAIKVYHDDPNSMQMVDSVQTTFKCCGATKGADDYSNLGSDIPDSCRVGTHDTPCTNILFRYMVVMIGLPVISTLIAFILLLGIIFSCCQCCAIRRDTSYEAVDDGGDMHVAYKGGDVEMEHRYQY